MTQQDSKDASERESVIACLSANHANTLAMLDCLRACDVDAQNARPYRRVEDELETASGFALSTQTPHVLIGLLVEAGGIARVDVSEKVAGTSSDAAASSDDASLQETPESVANPTPIDQPVDYVLHITQAGREALAAYQPARRFAELISQEPEAYFEVYAQILDACSNEGGVTRAAIEELVGSNPTLFSPKRVYPSYFVSKLETIGGLIWDGTWRTTDAGSRMLDTVPVR